MIDVSPSERKILLASGAAAGMSATFGAPLASVMLAIELLLFEFSTRAFIPLVVAASIAGGIHSTIFGSGPLFSVPAHDYAGLGQLPAYGVLGLACGLLAVIIAKGLFAVEHGFRRLPVDEFWHPAIGAVFFGIVGLFVPRALGVGYDAIDDALGGHLAVGVLAGLLVAKLLAWWVALGSGTSGGTLAPILLISATFGGLLGRGMANLAPGLGVSAGAFAVVAMAATFGSATRAPFTAIVFVFELTRDYNVVLPLMLATRARLTGGGGLPPRQPDDREAHPAGRAGRRRAPRRRPAHDAGRRRHEPQGRDHPRRPPPSRRRRPWSAKATTAPIPSSTSTAVASPSWNGATCWSATHRPTARCSTSPTATSSPLPAPRRWPTPSPSWWKKASSTCPSSTATGWSESAPGPTSSGPGPSRPPSSAARPVGSAPS